MRANVVAVVQQKGGVGKTTTTVNLARAAAVTHDARVLVVDLDSQGNASTALTVEPIAPTVVTIADVMVGDVSLPDVIVPTIWEQVDLAPATSTLAVALDQVAAANAGREHRLRKALDTVADQYDLVLIDTPPALGLSVVNALTAAHHAVIVAEPDAWSADGIADVAVTVADVREYLNPNLTVAGVLLNRVRQTSDAAAVTAELVDGIGGHLPGVPVWTDRAVPLWADIARSVHAGRGLDQGDARLRALVSRVYAPLAGELLGKAAA